MFDLPLLHSKYFSVLSLVRLLIGELNKNKPTPSLIKNQKEFLHKSPIAFAKVFLYRLKTIQMYSLVSYF